MSIRQAATRSLAIALGILGSTGVAAVTPAAHAALRFHSTMDNAAQVETPATYQALYSPPNGAIPGPSHVTFVPGRFGNAAKVDNGGGPWDGSLRFKAANFDFDDPAQDGGRLDVWIRFDQDPHTYLANAWVLRTNYPNRNLNWEMVSGDMMLDVYGEVPASTRTNYEKFRVNPVEVSQWEGVSAGEWHLFTFLWRNNGGAHKDEIHYFVDGVLQGSDYNGDLPVASQLTDLIFCPLLYDNEIDVTFDEVYGFDSWNVAGISGNFADIQFAEGVNLTFPMDGRYPWWGNPVTESNVLTYEFFAVDNSGPQCGCDLYVNGALVGSVSTSTLTHTEITDPTPLPNGTHTWQVKCDGDRLVSPVNQFILDYSGAPAAVESFGLLKFRFL